MKDYGTVENAGTVNYLYEGNGGMDAVNWTNAFGITKNLAVGISASYYFGKVEHSRSALFPDSAFVHFFQSAPIPVHSECIPIK